MPKFSQLEAQSPATVTALRKASGGRYKLSAFGARESKADNQEAFLAALERVEDGDTLVMDGLYPITAGLVLSRPVSIIGHGDRTGFIANAAASRQYHILSVSASGIRLRDFRVSGATGDLTLGEPAGIHIHDPTAPQDGGVVAVSNVSISGITADDCETGIRVGYQADAVLGVIRGTSGVFVDSCRVEARQYGVEFFYSTRSRASRNNVRMLGTAAPGQHPGIRLCGADNCAVVGNDIWGQRDAGSVGIFANPAVAYGLPQYHRETSDCVIAGNSINNVRDGVYVSSAAGILSVDGNTFNSVTDMLQIESSAAPYDIPLRVNHLVFSNNTGRNVSNVATARGRFGVLAIRGNNVIGDDFSDGRFLFMNQPTTTRCEYLDVSDNVAVLRGTVGGATLVLVNTKEGEVHRLLNNRVSPGASGNVIGSSGVADFSDFNANNPMLPATLWATLNP